MGILRRMIRAVLRGLIWLLGAYWIVFLGYTIKNLAAGGPRAVVLWYRHISGATFHWDWRLFLAGQIAMLAITMISLLGFRHFGRAPSS